MLLVGAGLVGLVRVLLVVALRVLCIFGSRVVVAVVGLGRLGFTVVFLVLCLRVWYLRRVLVGHFYRVFVGCMRGLLVRLRRSECHVVL